MIKRPFAWLAIATLTTGTAFAQDNPSPSPVPPPPHLLTQPGDHRPPPPPPGQGEDGPPPPPEAGEHGHHPGDMRGGPGHHRETGTLLGVGVEPLPRALSSQLSLPEGFGVIVNFVVPGSAAEAAGIQPDDVLKMLNDQILVNPEQLATLVHSYADGQEVAVTAIRKGQETKLSVKLKKQALPEGHNHFEGPGRDGDENGPGRPGPERNRRDRVMPDFNQARADADGDDERLGPPAPPAPPVREILRELRPELKDLGQNVNRRVADQLQREITILREREGGSRSTKLDLEDARIVIRDDKGELEVKSDAGKRSLTAKDPAGKVVFSGPVNTPDERKAVPADILPRLEKLEKEEMPAFPEAPKADGASTSQNATPADAGSSPGISLSASADSF